MMKLLVSSIQHARPCLPSSSSPLFYRNIAVSRMMCHSSNKKESLPLTHPHVSSGEDHALHDDAVTTSNHRNSNYIIPTVSASMVCKGEIADELVESLMSFGASSVTITNGATSAAPSQEELSSGPVPWSDEKRKFWHKSKLIALFPAEQDVNESLSFAFQAIGLKEMLPYKIESVQHEDWEQEVKDMFQPTKISDNFWIVPKWSTPPDLLATNVILDPGLAFGTGDHPTTQLCLQWLKQTVTGGENVLDYGTGSGILAISALKLGAGHAVGVDIDPIAVTSAKQNASFNGFGQESLDVVLVPSSNNGEIPIENGAYDIVIANLLLNPVLQLSSNLLGYIRAGGCLGLSGILESQVDQVLDVYAAYLENVEVDQVLDVYAAYLENVEVQLKDGWACVTGIKIVARP